MYRNLKRGNKFSTAPKLIFLQNQSVSFNTELVVLQLQRFVCSLPNRFSVCVDGTITETTPLNHSEGKRLVFFVWEGEDDTLPETLPNVLISVSMFPRCGIETGVRCGHGRKVDSVIRVRNIGIGWSVSVSFEIRSLKHWKFLWVKNSFLEVILS